MPAQPTANRGYRIPAGSDRPYGALQIIQLATDVDNDVEAQVLLLQQATANLTERAVGRSSNVAVPDSAVTDIPGWAATPVSNTGDIGYTGGNSHLDIGTAGSYDWRATAQWPATSGNHSRQMFVRINGTEPPFQNGHQTWQFNGFQGAVPLSTGGKIQLAKGDQVTLAVYHNFGSQLVLSGAFFSLSRDGG